ncbi:MAG: metallophosphoesterase [Bacteroidales bacterium]|jgi:predicted MPP superfamily phosphohydrolase|nr:metallophosphoesterase [Bacteroidales bacterium]
MMTLVFTFSLLGDAWLNYWIKAHREQLPQKVCRVFLQILYVSTACLVVMCVCFLILPLPFEDWTPFWKTYPIGVIIIFICLKIILSGVFFLQYGCSRIPALKSQASPKHWFQAGLWAVVLAFGIMVYGTVYEAFNLRVQREGITDKSIPESFGGYKIVQLSDLHIGSQISEQYTRKVVDSINAQNPDLVVFTGDMLNLHTDEMRPFVSLLSEIRAKDGIYAILGNHDYGGYLRWESQKDSMDNIQGLLNIYQSLNWQVLQNAHTVLYRGQDSIVLAGVDDYSSKKSKRRHSFADTKKALSGTSQSDFIVMLSHNPQHFEEELQTDYPHVNLTLSGHSHGGQMSV